MSKLSDFRPQSRNANVHTERGLWMLDEAIAEGGWIGGITTAADGEVFDGSARLETAYTRFGEDVEPIVVDIDGTRPVIMRRVDIPTADDPKAKKLSVQANRIASVDLNWDTDVLAEFHDEVDLSGLFTEKEFDYLFERESVTIPITQEVKDRPQTDYQPAQVFGGAYEQDDDDDSEDEDRKPSAIGGQIPLAIVLSSAELKRWKAVKEKLGVVRDQSAFVKALEILENSL
jgi:hypothetical protein